MNKGKIVRDERGRFMKGNQIKLGTTFKFPKEHNKKISESLKKAYKEGRKEKVKLFGEKNPFYKKKHSEETKKKMSIKKLGYIPWNKNKKVDKVSGKNHHFYGKHLTEEHRKKISISGKGKHFDYKPSEETRKKMSIIQKKIHNQPKYKELSRKNRAKQIFPVKDTTIEVKIQNFLKKLGIEFFTHQYMKEIEHAYQCDVLIPSMNLVIECDGDYWHKYPIGLENDHIRTKELIERGFKVLRLWERDINSINLNQFKSIIKRQ